MPVTPDDGAARTAPRSGEAAAIADAAVSPTTPADRADAAVVICAYTERRWHELEAAVASVATQTVPPRELVVVIDNNPALLARARDGLTVTHVVPNHHGPGISGGRNTGFDVSAAQILVFLDDDATAEPQWLAALTAAYSDPTVLGAGGPVLPVWQDGKPDWFTDELNWVVGCTWTGMAEHDGAVIRNPVGANMSVRRDVFESVGGFTGALGRREQQGKVVTGAADETDFCIRAARRFPGRTFRFVQDARVHHMVPTSRATFRYYRERCVVEGRSKAVLTGLSGAKSGLASERTYVRSVLPRAILRELARRDLAGIRRAGAIIAGAGLTAAAYAEARIVGSVRTSARHPT